MAAYAAVFHSHWSIALWTDDASIELHSHGHPSTIGSGMNTDVSSDDWFVKAMCYHNVAVVVASE